MDVKSLSAELAGYRLRVAGTINVLSLLSSSNHADARPGPGEVDEAMARLEADHEWLDATIQSATR
jgi:hypothetical protein